MFLFLVVAVFVFGFFLVLFILLLDVFNCFGRLPEWPKGADCKSAGIAYGGSNPSSATSFAPKFRGIFFGVGADWKNVDAKPYI